MNRTSMKLIADGQPHQRRHPLESGGVKITTFVPLRFKKRGIKKVVMIPAGVGEAVILNSSPAITTSHDSVLLRALGRAYYWQNMIDSCKVADAAEIAEREGIHRTTINEVLRLALLSPDIAQAAIEGKLSRTVSLERLLRTKLPLDWNEQWEMISALG